MKTLKIILATFSYFILATNVEGYSRISQPSIANSVVDSTNVGQLKLIAPSPNPTSGATTVGFSNSQPITYSFYVFDVHGDTVYTMASKQNAVPGSHSFIIQAGTLIPGAYLCSLQAGKAILSKRFLVVK